MNTIPSFLRVVFAVELFERISYYGVRTLLVLFLISHFGFQDARAYAAYSVTAALVYSTPVLAGVLADRVFGFQRMIVLGGILIAFGQITILCSMFDSGYFFMGLGMLVVGTGFFKANINSLLGTFYYANDANRMRGFVFLHVGVNIGSALASILCGYIAYYYGWYYGFSLATLGILISLVIFFKNRYVFGEHGASPNPNLLRRRYAGLSIFDIMLIVCLAFGIFFGHVIEGNLFTTRLFHYFGLAVLCVFFGVIIKSNERKRLIALGLLMVCLIVFFAMEMQLGSLITLFADRNVSSYVFGYPIPATVSQSINPISIIIIGLFVSIRKSRSNKHQISKFIFGMLTTSLCFGLLYYGCLNADQDYRVSYFYFLAAVITTGFGELIVWPFVQSQITALSPVHLRGFMMSLVMLFMGFANVAGIYIGRFMAVPTKEGFYDASVSLSIYANGFKTVALYNTLFVVAFLPMFYFIKLVIAASYKSIEKSDHVIRNIPLKNLSTQAETFWADNKKESENMFFNKKKAHAKKPSNSLELENKGVVKSVASKKPEEKEVSDKSSEKKVVAKKTEGVKADVKKSKSKEVSAKKDASKKAVVKSAGVKRAVSKRSLAKPSTKKQRRRTLSQKNISAKKGSF